MLRLWCSVPLWQLGSAAGASRLSELRALGLVPRGSWLKEEERLTCSGDPCPGLCEDAWWCGWFMRRNAASELRSKACMDGLPMDAATDGLASVGPNMELEGRASGLRERRERLRFGMAVGSLEGRASLLGCAEGRASEVSSPDSRSMALLRPCSC